VIAIDAGLTVLGPQGLARFQMLQADAVGAVTERFYATHGLTYARSGPRGRDACREDLALHLQFLRPALEFGLLQPMVDYLCWLGSVLAARAIPAEHVALSLDLLAEFFAGHMDTTDGAVVTAALEAAHAGFLEAGETPVPSAWRPDPWPEAARFEAALLAGHPREALAVMDRCIDSGAAWSTSNCILSNHRFTTSGMNGRQTGSRLRRSILQRRLRCR
jgi:hypothetical protein